MAVVPVTGTPGPPATHIPLTAGAGLTRYDQAYADVTALQPVDRAALLRQRGRLVPSEVERLAVQLRTYLGCDEAGASLRWVRWTARAGL